ncbi:MAG: tetratricopeptide repeat protein [Anaerolineae bacterium]|nr:tetratricopeptide repeat protein [Anaerolineae bacterium]
MLGTQPLENVHYRMAQHYLSKLRAAEAAYQRGHENWEHALAVFDHEWLQIKQWWLWAAAHVEEGADQQFASLCKEFSLAGGELLAARLYPQERLQLMEAGLTAARLLHDQRAEMVHLYYLARTYTRIGQRDTAMNLAQQLLTLAERLNNRLYKAKAFNVMGMVFYHTDNYEQAQRMYGQALAISSALGEKSEMGLAVNGLGHIAHIQADFENARRYDGEYLAIAEATGQPYDVCMALRNLSGTALHMGDEPAAVAYAERCVTLCEAIGYKTCLVGILVILGDLISARGDLVQAREYYQRSLALSREVNHPANEALALCQLGRLSRQLGDLPASLGYLEAVLEVSEAIGERWYGANALLEMTSTLRVANRIEEALVKWAAGLEMAAALQSPVIQGIYLLEAAWLWYEQGYMEEATLWLGFLKANWGILVSEGHADYAELYSKLEARLGQIAFAAVLETGKTLNLEHIMQGLLDVVQNGNFR